MAPRASVTLDPALERYNKMREDVYKHFRWTKSTTRTAIVSLVVVPGLCIFALSQQDAKYSWMGKRKDESLAGN